MPEEDGYSLVRKLRSLQLATHMLAIAVTGYASKGDVAAAIQAGFDLHVPKPVDFDTFVPMVKRLTTWRGFTGAARESKPLSGPGPLRPEPRKASEVPRETGREGDKAEAALESDAGLPGARHAGGLRSPALS